MSRRIAIATTAALLALAAPASGRIVQATSVLPPGESGFVSVPGVADGTGSPHLYDQQSLFASFQRKSDMLGQPGQEEDPKAGVKIVRDNYGVPSITGDNDADAWWGAGYATAEDRLFEIELFKRATTGRLAEILGKSYLPSDIATRRDFYTPQEIDQMLKALPQYLQQRYQSYLDGINAWVSKVQLDPSQLPAEYPATGDSPQPFTLEDLGAIGVYLARTTPNGDGSDLTNAHALDSLGPSRFNRLLPLRVPGQIPTVPARSGRFPSVPGRTKREERAALRRSTAFVRGLPLPGGDQPSGSPDQSAPQSSTPLPGLPIPPNPIHVGGSYMVARRDGHHAFLFNGPELGFTAPEELYELEVHAPGLDVRGITAPGAPIIAIGHNQHVAFGLTSGLSQTNALYAEKLVPGHPDQYVFDGQTKTMICRDEQFSYHSPPTDLLGGSSPESGSETVSLCRTVHGPVQARAGGVAYARRYATWGREAQTIVGLARVDQAASVRDVNAATADLTWNENIMAADDQGHIGYWHPGLLPIEPKRWDERLPFPGDGSAEWRGFLPLSRRPHAIDPKQGWLANWNNVPSAGWTTGNDPASERVAGRWFRVGWLDRLVQTIMVKHHPSFSGLNEVVRLAGTTAQQRPLATRNLHRALRGATGGAATVLRAIVDWDGSYDRVDSNGTLAPGVAAWQIFKEQAQAIALGRLGPGARLIGGEEPNDEHLYDVSLGQAYALRTLSTEGWRRAAKGTYAALVKRFGPDPASWREPRHMFPQSSLGAEQPPPLAFFDRGTYEQLIELGP